MFYHSKIKVHISGKRIVSEGNQQRSLSYRGSKEETQKRHEQLNLPEPPGV